MKYVESETDRKKPRYLLAVGGPELKVLEGLLANAARHMPMAGRSGYENGEYMSTARTIRNMLSEVQKAVKDIKEDG
jgi:hypothetical protein